LETGSFHHIIPLIKTKEKRIKTTICFPDTQ
jgi:hypothetical protein